VNFKNSPGFGYHFGAEVTIHVKKQFGISLEANYLSGGAKFPLTGSVTGGNFNGTNQRQTVDFADGKIDFTGVEFSIGIIFSGR
jgi:hypothetical protein